MLQILYSWGVCIGLSPFHVLVEKKGKKKRPVVFSGGGITIVSNVQINQMEMHSKSKDKANTRAAKWTAYQNCFEKKKKKKRQIPPG